MRRIQWTNQFRKDYKLAQKQGKDINALKEVITILAGGEQLPHKCRDHPLRGDWIHHRDCRIKSDWVLIYRIEGDVLILERMETHSELFR